MEVSYDVNCDFIKPCIVVIDEETVCPICKHALRPHMVYGTMYKNNLDENMLCMVYLCPHCYENFIVTYDHCENKSGYNPFIFNNRLSIAPSKFEKQTFEECISNLSPSFVKIYNQALEAEHYNLDEIAGIGYRKALEFLIKDYCSYKNPTKTDEIQKAFLAKCIEDNIVDTKLKKSAKVSTWLGNDETHYIRKFTNKDINDLKKFINTTVYFILYNFNVDEADEILNSE